MKQDYLQIKMLEVADQVFASPQLFEADLGLIAKQGARSIVSILPDVDLEQAASEHGIRFVSFPIRRWGGRCRVRRRLCRDMRGSRAATDRLQPLGCARHQGMGDVGVGRDLLILPANCVTLHS